MALFSKLDGKLRLVIAQLLLLGWGLTFRIFGKSYTGACRYAMMVTVHIFCCLLLKQLADMLNRCNGFTSFLYGFWCSYKTDYCFQASIEVLHK